MPPTRCKDQTLVTSGNSRTIDELWFHIRVLYVIAGLLAVCGVTSLVIVYLSIAPPSGDCQRTNVTAQHYEPTDDGIIRKLNERTERDVTPRRQKRVLTSFSSSRASLLSYLRQKKSVDDAKLASSMTTSSSIDDAVTSPDDVEDDWVTVLVVRISLLNCALSEPILIDRLLLHLPISVRHTRLVLS